MQISTDSHHKEKTTPNTHCDIQFLLMAFNQYRLVQVEYDTNELLHLQKMQIICKKKSMLQLFLKHNVVSLAQITFINVTNYSSSLPAL